MSTVPEGRRGPRNVRLGAARAPVRVAGRAAAAGLAGDGEDEAEADQALVVRGGDAREAPTDEYPPPTSPQNRKILLPRRPQTSPPRAHMLPRLPSTGPKTSSSIANAACGRIATVIYIWRSRTSTSRSTLIPVRRNPTSIAALFSIAWAT